MITRRILVAATTALALLVPAHADEGLGVNTQFAGTVVSGSDEFPWCIDLGPLGNPCLFDLCSYDGQTTATGGFQYQFSGQAVAFSGTQSQPELTDVKCTLSSPAQGLPGELPTQTASCEISLAGPASACVATVSNWPARPVVICVDGYAIFGPTPVITKTATHACKTSTL